MSQNCCNKGNGIGNGIMLIIVLFILLVVAGACWF